MPVRPWRARSSRRSGQRGKGNFRRFRPPLATFLALQLTPAPFAVPAPQSPTVADVEIDCDGFDIRDTTGQLKVHSLAPCSRAPARGQRLQSPRGQHNSKTEIDVAEAGRINVTNRR